VTDGDESQQTQLEIHEAYIKHNRCSWLSTTTVTQSVVGTCHKSLTTTASDHARGQLILNRFGVATVTAQLCMALIVILSGGETNRTISVECSQVWQDPNQKNLRILIFRLYYYQSFLYELQ
jgi:hypothetical protein